MVPAKSSTRAHKKAVLHDRHGDAEDIDFLKGIGTDERCCHLTGDCHHRNRIKKSIGNARDQIGRARS